MPVIEIPDVGEVEFPDSMAEADIAKAAGDLYGDTYAGQLRALGLTEADAEEARRLSDRQGELLARQKQARESGEYQEGVISRIDKLTGNAVEPLTRPLSGAFGRAVDALLPGPPVVEPTIQQGGINLPRAGEATTGGGKVAAGVYNAGRDLLSMFSNPDTLVLLPAGTSKPVLTAWIAQMAGHAPERVLDATRLFKEGRTQEGVEQIVLGAAELGMAEMGRRHVMPREGVSAADVEGAPRLNINERGEVVDLLPVETQAIRGGAPVERVLELQREEPQLQTKEVMSRGEEAQRQEVLDRPVAPTISEPTPPPEVRPNAPAPAAETTTFIDPRSVPVGELPVARLKLSKDVPNFKEEADVETGVVRGQELKGGYERLGTAPIVVWERLTGDLEVITGRHRLDLAKRSGEKTIPAQIVREAEGFTKEHALTFDAEANIRDGQGSVKDYAHYFRNSSQRLTEAEAQSRGLLSRAKGKAGFDLGRNASDDIYALYAADKITEGQALAIARAAPGNEAAQRLGVNYAALGRPPEFIANLIKAVVSETGGKAETLDLFGKDDSALRQAEEQARRAAAAQKEIREQIQAVSGASKRPEVARKLGVDVKDPAAVAAKLSELRAEQVRWENWPLHPDLVARTRGTEVKVAETLKPTAETLTLAPPETIAEQQARLAVEEQARVAAEAARAQQEREATAKRTMLEKAAARLGGDLGTAGQGGLFAEPGQGEMFKPPSPGNINTGALGELGMGGAKPSEFVPGGRPTSIKNAQVDVERAQRGLPPAMEPLRRSFGDVWDQAMDAIDRDPARLDRLVAELYRNPRALTDLEDAMLLHRQADLQNQYARATRDLANAYEDSKSFPNRLEDYEAGRVRVQELSDELFKLYEVNKSVGTETARGLNARKMFANEDFTLAEMEMQMRAANDGEPLNAAQRAELAVAHEKIAALQRQFDEATARLEQESAARAAAESVAAMERRTAEELRVTYDPRILKIANEIVGKLETQAEGARARLREKLSHLTAGVDPTIIYDLGVIGAAKIARKGLDVARFTAEMVGEFGEKIRPFINDVWAAANQHLENEGAKYGDKAEPVKRLLRKRDELSRRDGILAGIQRAIDDGQPLEMLGRYVQALAESYLRGGIRGREPLIDAVHATLKEKFSPDITRRQTMDAISGYGSFKALNPDAIKAELRGLKGQMQQVAKLEDIQKRRPLKKTGIERRVVSDEERRLIQQVNEAKRRFGVVVTDPARQLKSALDATATRLRNQIADLEFEIANKSRIVKTRTPAPGDATTQQLEARRDALRLQRDQLLPRPGLTDAQRAEMAARGIERDIATLETRIRNRDVAPSEMKRAPANSPHLEALRARRLALKAEWEALRDTLDPGRAERVELSTLKARMLAQEAGYTERLARGEFKARERREVTLDEEALRIKARLEMAKAAWKRGRDLDQLKRRSVFVRTGHAIREALNLPRAMLSSWDVSAVLRQGGFIALGHPMRAAKALGPMFRSLASEERAAMVQQEILNRPNAPLYARAKLYLAPLESVKLSAMEEQFMSSLANRIPGVKQSNRAFVTFLNKLRSDSFDAMVDRLQGRGAPALNDPELRAIANYINIATGRGDLGRAAAAAETLATAFFSPRLVASRFQLLLGKPAWGGSARTRAAVAGEYARFLGGLAVVYAMANLAGGTVGTDPRSSDFGKIKFGETRVDPLTGLSQVSVLLSRLGSGETTTGSGQVKPIRGAVPYGESTASDVLFRFLRSKLAPVPGAALNLLSGEDVVGEPVTPGSVAQNLVTPLSFSEIYDVMKAQGVPAGTALGILSLFGWGLQQHDNPAIGRVIRSKQVQAMPAADRRELLKRLRENQTR